MFLFNGYTDLFPVYPYFFLICTIMIYFVALLAFLLGLIICVILIIDSVLEPRLNNDLDEFLQSIS